MERIAIIGSGFCGSALAIQLLHQATRPLSISLINRSGRFARGLAYGTRSSSHILNVPAERMSLFPGQPGDFLEFARTFWPAAQPGDFLPRQLYGDYLEHRLEQAIALSGAQINFERRHAQVSDLNEHDRGLRLQLSDGTALEVDAAVIATGNFAPATPPALAALRGDPRYVEDPWAPGALAGMAPEARIVLLGTGLTLFDMALALQDQGHRAPLLAVSRRGLLPHAHRDNVRAPRLPTLPAGLDPAVGLGDLLTVIRRWATDAVQDGYDWRDALAALRPATPALWQGLDAADRRRFLRHLQPYWEVHRHRAAPSVARRVTDLIASGGLSIQAGRLFANQDLTLTLRPRGQTVGKELPFDHLINCTGPCNDLRALEEPLFAALQHSGQIRPDPLSLGVETAADYRVLDASGRPHPRLFLLSPMLRARHWESTAVPELREHAQRLSRLLLAATPRID